MSLKQSLKRSAILLVAVLCGTKPLALAQQETVQVADLPSNETLSYRVEWRMITAGEAKVTLSREQQDWQLNLNLESAGLVNRLYHIQDAYKLKTNDRFCGVSSDFEAREGKRHIIETQRFDNARHKSAFEMHDLVKNKQEKLEVDIAPCTYDIMGALVALRTLRLEPGRSTALPVVHGNKMAYPKIVSQARENLTIDGKTYQTVRYEAFIFDNVIFRRHGSLFVWVSEEAKRVPVQLRFQMGFPIGSISLELQKDSHT
jgi:hypothetical protein